VSAPAKSQFLRPMPIGRRARSAGLLSIATRPTVGQEQAEGVSAAQAIAERFSQITLARNAHELLF
jgi:hypothetical protein